MICTIYSHHLLIDDIAGILQQVYEDCQLTGQRNETEATLYMTTVDNSGRLTFKYRQRIVPSYFLPQEDDCPLTTNLKGMYGYVAAMPTINEEVKNLLLQKIMTINSETSVSFEGEVPALSDLIALFAEQFDAVLFMQPGTPISKSNNQHFLDSNLNLIIDPEGNCDIDTLEVKISSEYFDDPVDPTDEQLDRKEKTETLLKSKKIKINPHLPCTQSIEQTTLRSPEEIARRICVLATTNFMAFNEISNEGAFNYLQANELWDYVTPEEKDFIFNPNEEKKINETWKCEGIWLLMWILKKIPKLEFPTETCKLSDIPYEQYPVGPGKDTSDFINSVKDMRSVEEILDIYDIHYRLNWAATDARINGLNIDGFNPGVVYERLYALNWVINYRNQQWDDIRCDS